MDDLHIPFGSLAGGIKKERGTLRSFVFTEI
jgi:hypothetical protein